MKAYCVLRSKMWETSNYGSRAHHTKKLITSVKIESRRTKRKIDKRNLMNEQLHNRKSEDNL